MFLMFGLLVAAAILTAIALIYKLKYKYLIDVTSDIPSAPALPIIGHALYFINKPSHKKIEKLREFLNTYGNTVKVWLGPELNIMMADVKDVEAILGSMAFLEKAGEYKALEPWLREGLLVSRGRKWHKRRKAITPAFHFNILAQFIEVFERESRVLVANLERERQMQGSEGCNLYDWINLCTLDTICETAMGVSVLAQTNADSEYVQAVKTISTVTHKRMFDIIYRFDFTYQFTSVAREEKCALAVLHGFTERIILQRREELLCKHNATADMAASAEKSKANDYTTTEVDNDNDVGAKRKQAFLDILLQSQIDGKPLSNLDIREEVDTFMFEGHDTTSSAINFFFYNIAIYPECQSKCFAEIVDILGTDKSKPVTYDILNKLNYVELCIKETLRMFPSVPLLGRKVTQECEINGKVLPAGTNIGIAPFHLGRQPHLFPEPNSFKPERFDISNGASKITPYAYIPFSAGPRNCIGQRFAVLEVKSVVTNVLRHFEIEFVGDSTTEPILIAELILRTKDPLMFMLKPRVY
ncbi:PREDICTED: cytochrome P450 4d1 [Rhagoletis zephyria]|uniref:cytochrome P450 4d1 n=1 Tax=Rhagoletis zephyria TaxID=28612 RepID=UPI0008114F87|nr:PREDICTED: cytochrome P450 4d1 [Rhagoletis zephyria]